MELLEWIKSCKQRKSGDLLCASFAREAKTMQADTKTLSRSSSDGTESSKNTVIILISWWRKIPKHRKTWKQIGDTHSKIGTLSSLSPSISRTVDILVCVVHPSFYTFDQIHILSLFTLRPPPIFSSPKAFIMIWKTIHSLFLELSRHTGWPK